MLTSGLSSEYRGQLLSRCANFVVAAGDQPLPLRQFHERPCSRSRLRGFGVLRRAVGHHRPNRSYASIWFCSDDGRGVAVVASPVLLGAVVAQLASSCNAWCVSLPGAAV
jgi:hypothetical protein